MTKPMQFAFNSAGDVFALLERLLHLSFEDAEWLRNLPPENLRALGEMLQFAASCKENV